MVAIFGTLIILASHLFLYLLPTLVGSVLHTPAPVYGDGNTSGNLLTFCTLSAVSFLLLLPGLNQHGVISKYTSMAKREINKLLKQKEKKNQ